MYKNLRWKLLTTVAVMVIFFGIGVYPILAQRYHWPSPAWLQALQLKLGLDLKGGVHLVMRVNTDDALKIATTSVSEQLRDSLKTSNIVPSAITVPEPTVFRVEGVPQASDAQFRAAADELAGTNYNRNPLAGGSYEFRMKPLVERDLREQAIEQSMQTIDRRINELGVTEPTIARQGNDQLVVQMPGLTDVARAKEIIRSTAILEFRLVEAGPGTKEDLLKQYNGNLPGDMEMLPGTGAEGAGSFYVVKKLAPVTGQDLRVARPGLD